MWRLLKLGGMTVEEITDEVIESHPEAFDGGENRMYIEKAMRGIRPAGKCGRILG